MNDYYTHREYLKNELLKLDYTNSVECLEFGTGDGSAMIFKELSEIYPNLTILSYESDLSWLNNTENKYKTNNYKFTHVESWDDLLQEKNFNGVYDLTFIDQSPWEARIKTIDLLKNKSKVIILHDYDYYNIGVCDNLLSTEEGSFFHKKYSEFFNMVTYYEQLPPTLVMTNKNLI